MAKYKIIQEFVLNGVLQKLDTVVELEHKMANLNSVKRNIIPFVEVEQTLEATTPAETIVVNNEPIVVSEPQENVVEVESALEETPVRNDEPIVGDEDETTTTETPVETEPVVEVVKEEV